MERRAMKSVERGAWSVEDSKLSAERRTPNAERCFISLLLLISVFSTSLSAADDPIERFLPSPGFSEGWVMEGKAKRFTADNLYMHINGEAELYIPFGFEVLGTALYAKTGNTDADNT